jgi:hypothetical protein
MADICALNAPDNCSGKGQEGFKILHTIYLKEKNNYK